MQELPAECLVVSDLAVIRLRRETARTAAYCGRSGGFSLRLAVDPDDWSFRAVLTLADEQWGQAETFTDGSSFSFSGVVTAVGEWLDSLATDDYLNDLARDRRYLDTAHGKVAYYAYNTELARTPALFVHGGPGGESSPVRMRTLRLDRPVYCYDQLGCGSSDRIPDLSSWEVDDYVAELRTVIEQLGLKEVILCGASWGAGLIMAYVTAYGTDGIKAFVLPSPFLCSRVWTDDQQANFKRMPAAFQEEMARCLREHDTGPAYHALMREYDKRFLFVQPENAPIADAAGDSYSDVFEALWGPDENVCTGPLQGFDVEPALAQIGVPTLFMCGDSDEVTLPTMARYRDLVPGAQLAVVPGAGHATAKDQPELYRQLLVRFLRDL